jgi:hypothetical protein
MHQFRPVEVSTCYQAATTWRNRQLVGCEDAMGVKRCRLAAGRVFMPALRPPSLAKSITPAGRRRLPTTPGGGAEFAAPARVEVAGQPLAEARSIGRVEHHTALGKPLFPPPHTHPSPLPPLMERYQSRTCGPPEGMARRRHLLQEDRAIRSRHALPRTNGGLDQNQLILPDLAERDARFLKDLAYPGAVALRTQHQTCQARPGAPALQPDRGRQSLR